MTSLRKTIAVLAVGAVALGAAAAANAQPQPGYGYNGAGGSYYDPCRRDTTNRETGGAILGGVLGAVLGSHVAANHHRSDGSVVGGVVGAVAGAAVGKSGAACEPAPPPRAAYYAPPPPPPPYAYEGAYRDDDRYGDEDWAYGRGGARLRIAEAPDADGCTLAESPIYMPDGRIQKRFVRVCRDPTGRYQVVD